MDLSTVTPVILTYNEEPNIERVLAKLSWATQIIVIDSYSTDRTLEILERYPRVVCLKRRFDSHEIQWNYGLEQVKTEWSLSLDSDYVLSDELIGELEGLTPESSVDGYFAPFKYCVFGKPLRGSILPPRQVLSRTKRCRYLKDGHTQLLTVDRASKHLSGCIYHDDRKALSRWLWAQDRYMLLEVEKLRNTPVQELSLGDRIRKQKVVAPFVILVYCLILKGGILDGWHGFYYAFQRMFAEVLLSLRLLEQAEN